MTEFPDFQDPAWNERREELEGAVKRAADELLRFAGGACRIMLPTDYGEIVIECKPKGTVQ